MPNLETYRDLLFPGLMSAMRGFPLTPEHWASVHPVAELAVEDGRIVLRVSDIAEPFLVVTPEEIANSTYKALWRERIQDGLGMAKVILADMEEPSSCH